MSTVVRTKFLKRYFIFRLILIVIIIILPSQVAAQSITTQLSIKESPSSILNSQPVQNGCNTNTLPKSDNVNTTNYASSNTKIISVTKNTLENDSLDERSSDKNLHPGIKIGGSPFKVAVNPKTNMVYVIDKYSKKITFIDANYDKPINTASLASIEPVILGFNRSDLYELRSDIGIDPETNLIYAITSDSSLLYTLDNDGKIIVNTTIMGSPFALDVTNLEAFIAADQYNGSSSRGVIFQVYPYFNRITGGTSLIADAFSALDVMKDKTMNRTNDKLFVVGHSTIYKFSLPFLPSEIVSSKPESEFPISNATLSTSLNDLSVNPNTDTVYITDRAGRDHIYVLDLTSNKTSTIHVSHLNTDLQTAVDVNPITNMVYVTNADSNTVSVINGTNNCLLTQIPVGASPRGLAIDQSRNIIYVANLFSGTLSVINGSTNKVMVGLSSEVTPPNAGWVECNYKKISNFTRYELGSPIKCNAKNSPGYQFSSWSGKGIDQNQQPEVQFKIMDYNELHANFIVAPELIPKEYQIALWALFASVLTGWLVPSIARWINSRKQFGKMSDILMDIESLSYLKPKTQEEVVEILIKLKTMKTQVGKMLIERKISESQYNILDKKISEYENRLSSRDKG